MGASTARNQGVRQSGVRLAEIVAARSLATDLGMGQQLGAIPDPSR